jgi:putative CocE/NonD family hydrolase
MIAKSPAPEKQTLLLGAWDHGGACSTGNAVAGTLDLGPDATIDSKQLWLDWFDHWLQPAPVKTQTWPRVRYYAMGANAWRDAAAWPPPSFAATEIFLDGEALSLTATTGSGSRSYRYDPNDPTPAMNRLVSDPLPEWSPRDTRYLESRSDVLVYSSQVFEQPLEIAGPVYLILHASSDAPDTDFAALLSDVAPDGRANLLSHGILRASFRESLSEPRPLKSGKVYELSIELADIGHVVLAGHRLRLIVCSALFPYYHPNPNSGDLYGDETADRRFVATQLVLSGGATPSRLRIFTLKG